jgi:hypothetical protein
LPSFAAALRSVSWTCYGSAGADQDLRYIVKRDRFHLSRGEVSSAITTIMLLVMVTYVADRSWKVKPILVRSLA